MINILTKIPDKLWDEISPILSTEKQNNTIGRPIVPYRKVMDGIVYVLRTGCQLKMLPKEYVLVLHVIGYFRVDSARHFQKDMD